MRQLYLWPRVLSGWACGAKTVHVRLTDGGNLIPVLDCRRRLS